MCICSQKTRRFSYHMARRTISNQSSSSNHHHYQYIFNTIIIIVRRRQLLANVHPLHTTRGTHVLTTQSIATGVSQHRRESNRCSFARRLHSLFRILSGRRTSTGVIVDATTRFDISRWFFKCFNLFLNDTKFVCVFALISI